MIDLLEGGESGSQGVSREYKSFKPRLGMGETWGEEEALRSWDQQNWRDCEVEEESNDRQGIPLASLGGACFGRNGLEAKKNVCAKLHNSKGYPQCCAWRLFSCLDRPSDPLAAGVHTPRGSECSKAVPRGKRTNA
jgi:hypothetical protein